MRGGQKGGNREQYINRIVKIFKIGFCAVMWSIVCNNYYEKLETFGGTIESLITAHYGDIINQATINELENVRGVITKYSLGIRGSVKEDDYRIRYDIGDPSTMNPEERKMLEEMKQKRADGTSLIKGSNLRQVEPPKRNVGEDVVEISYSQISSLCGFGLGNMIFGTGDKIVDMVKTFEREITHAFAEDTLNIIKKKVIDIGSKGKTTGNENTVLTQIGDVVTNLYAKIFQSSSSNYNNAPGTTDTINSYLSRSQAIRNRWNNWKDEANTANVNFIQDIIIHIRNTSYYLWIYYVFMQSLELYAVKKMLQLIPGSLENREDRQRYGEIIDSEASAFTNVRQDMDSMSHRYLGKKWARLPRAVTYLLLVAIFRGLGETVRFQIGRYPERYSQVDIINSIMKQDISHTIQTPSGQAKASAAKASAAASSAASSDVLQERVMTSSEILSYIRKLNDKTIPTTLVPRKKKEKEEEGETKEEAGVEHHFETAKADADERRTANDIRIPNEDIDIDFNLIDNAIKTIQGQEEEDYLNELDKKGGKRKKRKTRKKKRRKRKKKKTRKRRR